MGDEYEAPAQERKWEKILDDDSKQYYYLNKEVADWHTHRLTN